MGSGVSKADLKRLIGGAVFDISGAGVIAFALFTGRDHLLWAGVGLMAVGSFLIVSWARVQSKLENAISPAQRRISWAVERELALPTPRRVDLTSAGRWRFFLWLAAAAAAVLYTNGYPRRAQPMEEAFEQFGIETSAAIHDKQQRAGASGEERYYLYYHFEDRNGEEVRASTTVPAAVYESLGKGARIPVLYLPDDPFTHQLHGLSEQRLRRGGLAALGALLAALAVLEAQRRKHRRLVARGSTAGGTVLRVSRLGSTAKYTVEVETGGVRRTLTYSERAGRLEVGDRLTVLYSPEKPSDAVVYREAVYRALA